MNRNAPNTDWRMWVNYSLEPGNRSSSKVNLLLTIVFNKHHVDLIGGTVWFGLRSGELALRPTNATIPMSDRWPQMTLAPAFEAKREFSRGASSKNKVTRSLTMGATLLASEPRASTGASYGTANEQEQSVKMNDEFLHFVRQITWKGHEHEALLAIRGNAI